MSASQGLGVGLTALSIGGSFLQRKEAKKGIRGATEAQLQGILSAIQEQRRQFDVAKGFLEPFIGAGKRAVSGLEELSVSPETGVAFQGQLGRSRKALTDFLSARGLLGSGFGAERATELETRAVGEAQERRTGILSQLLNVGRTAAGQAASGAQTLGQQISQLLTSAGTARGKGILGVSQQRGGFFGDVTSALAGLPKTIELLKQTKTA